MCEIWETHNHYYDIIVNCRTARSRGRDEWSLRISAGVAVSRSSWRSWCCLLLRKTRIPRKFRSSCRKRNIMPCSWTMMPLPCRATLARISNVVTEGQNAPACCDAQRFVVAVRRPKPKAQHSRIILGGTCFTPSRAPRRIVSSATAHYRSVVPQQK